MLTSKRGHEGAVVALVTAGADIFKQDDRSKTAYGIDRRRGYVHLLKYLCMDTQISLMQQASRIERSHTLTILSDLLNQRRATLTTDVTDMEYKQGISIAMRLPDCILHMVSEMIPLSPFYDRKLHCLRIRAVKDPHGVVVDSMKVYDQLFAETFSDERVLKTAPARHLKVCLRYSIYTDFTNL